jgi:enoyl-CoA hydratase/carnithine racemase
MKSNQDSSTGPVRVTEDEPGIAIITIDRVDKRNALNLEIKKKLADSVEKLSADPNIRVIVLTGAGGIFVAGTDLAEMAEMSPTDHTLLATDRVFKVLNNCPKPLIAAIEGYALGGGCELALACDVLIAGESTRMGQPEIRVGVMPGAGGTQKLLRTIGKYRTMKLILTGEFIKAGEAYTMGLLSEVVRDGQSLDRAVAIARTILGMPPLAVSAIKEVIRFGQDVPLDTALQLERKTFQLLFDTADQKEGMVAFLEKRSPNYLGK